MVSKKTVNGSVPEPVEHQPGLVGTNCRSGRFPPAEYSNEVTINISCLHSCQFIDCKFYNCTFEGKNKKNNPLQFIGCDGLRDILIETIETEEGDTQQKDYYRTVLEQYWRPGRANADPKHTYRTLLKGLKTSELGLVDQAIKVLKNRGILFNKGPYLILNMKMINEIKGILGRN